MATPVTQFGEFETILLSKLEPMKALDAPAKIKRISFEPFASASEIMEIVENDNLGLPSLLVSMPTETVNTQNNVIGTQACRMNTRLTYLMALVNGNAKNTSGRFREVLYVQRDRLLDLVGGLWLEQPDWPTKFGTKVPQIEYVGMQQMLNVPQFSIAVFQFTFHVYWTVRRD